MNKVKPQAYQCAYCTRGFVQKREYELHYGTCELFHKSRTELSLELDKNDADMTPEHMKTLIKVLVRDLAIMKKEVSELKNKINHVKNKTDLLSFLKQKYKTIDTDLSRLIELSDFNEKHLELLFTANYSKVINQWVNQRFENPECCPIRSFSQNIKSCYCYDEGEWRKMTDHDWTKLSEMLEGHIISQFRQWSQLNESKLEDVKYSLTYHSYTKKVMACLPKVKQCLTRAIIQKTQVKINNITTYEIIFV